jgi:hypothetical protein
MQRRHFGQRFEAQTSYTFLSFENGEKLIRIVKTLAYVSAM